MATISVKVGSVDLYHCALTWDWPTGRVTREGWSHHSPADARAIATCHERALPVEEHERTYTDDDPPQCTQCHQHTRPGLLWVGDSHDEGPLCVTCGMLPEHGGYHEYYPELRRTCSHCGEETHVHTQTGGRLCEACEGDSEAEDRQATEDDIERGL